MSFSQLNKFLKISKKSITMNLCNKKLTMEMKIKSLKNQIKIIKNVLNIRKLSKFIAYKMGNWFVWIAHCFHFIEIMKFEVLLLF